MIKKILISIILFIIFNDSSITILYCQPKKEEISQLSVSKYFLGYKYYYGDVIINRKNFYELIELVPSARVELRVAKRKRIVSGILSFAGGFLIGWPMGEVIKGKESPNWELAGFGLLLLFTSIGFEGSLSHNYQKAADNFNAKSEQLNPDVVAYIVNKNRYNKHQYDFELIDGKIIYGELLSKRDEELYVKDKSFLYIINLDKLKAIYQNKVDVTDSVLSEAPSKYIDLFNYDVKEID